MNCLVCFSTLPVRQKSSAVSAAKPSAVSSKGEFIVTKLDDLVNWARRVRSAKYERSPVPRCIIVLYMESDWYRAGTSYTIYCCGSVIIMSCTVLQNTPMQFLNG